MTRLDLPDGEWAELASPRKVSDRRRRSFLAAMNDTAAATADLPQVANPRSMEAGQPLTIPDPARMTGAQAELQFHAFDLLVLCFVKAWSFPDPVSLEAVEDLDTGAKDTLTAACLPLLEDLMPDYSPDVDPKARTSGSTPPPPRLSEEGPVLSATHSSGNTS